MGRPSIYGRAMTSAERQARYLERQARKLAVREQPQPVKPLAVPNPAETMVRVQALKLDPLRVMTWVHQRLGDTAFLRVCAACDELRTAIHHGEPSGHRAVTAVNPGAQLLGHASKR